MTYRYLRKSVVLVLFCGALARGQVCNLKVVTDASPDYYNVDSMIHSITSKWPTPSEKCWALFYWNHIARRQTSPMKVHGMAVTDPIRQFNDYGYMMCSTIAGTNCAIWDAMGLRTKYWDIAMHTVSEVEYDGRWHMYDNSMSALYTLCDGKTIAGVEDIGKKGGCAASGGKVGPGHIAKYHCLYATSKNGFLTGADCMRSLEHEYHCFNPNALKYRYYYYDWDRGHRYVLNVRDGETYTRYYSRRDENRPDAVVQNERQPKYKASPAYYVPNNGKDPETPNTRYHIRGNGEWEWKPKLTAADYKKAIVSEANIVATKPAGLRPLAPGKPAEVVFKVNGANVITSQVLKLGMLRKTDADSVSVSVSTNNGLTWKEVWRAKKVGDLSERITLVEEVNGAYEVLLRVSMTAAAAPADVALKSIAFETRTMLNGKTQPKLNLGKNTVYVGVGEQADTIVLWPDLQGDEWKPYAVEHHNMTSQEKHPGYMGVMHAVRPDEDAYVVLKVDAPRDITSVTYGGRLYNRAPRAHIDFLHSFDGGKTWTKSYSLTDTKPPWDVIHYETVNEIPVGARSVLFKYLLNAAAVGTNTCSIYAVRLEANHKPVEPGFKPIEVTFNWSERRDDYSLAQRSHTQLIEKAPLRYTINVGGVDHPVVNSLRVRARGSDADATYGYSDGKDIEAEKFVGRWVTYGKNLAEGKEYTLSHPSIGNWGAGDPDGKKLTDGVTGPPYAGGNSYKYGACWNARTNPVITLDLGAPKACASFGMDFHGYPWWDALQGQVKDKVEVLTSLDGEDYESQGSLKTDLRWVDLPANHMWPDDERITGHTFRLIPEKPVETRYVKYKVTSPRIFDCTELEVLDSIKFEPCDLRIALPDEKPPAGAVKTGEAAAGQPRAAGQPSAPAADPRNKAKPVSDPVLEPPTLRSLGTYWLIGGDANRNAKVKVTYRKVGAEEWMDGPPLFRVERDRHKNDKGKSALNVSADAWLFAGSIVLLEPGMEYELKLSLSDPDGGEAEELLKTRTTAEPIAPPGLPEFHVVPGNGGGNGTADDPYKGLAAAQAKAKAGNVFLLHAGRYDGTFLVTRSGSPGKPIIWRGAGDGEAIIDGQGEAEKRPGRGVSANDAHDVWFENLTIRNADYGFVGHNGYRVVIRACHFHRVEYGITCTNNSTGRVRDWLIADSVIEGPSTWPRTKGIENARGIQVTGTGHVVCYNRIRGFADAIDTFPSSRCSAIDFHNNDISEMTDDGIEMDYSFRNTRCFHNRLTNVFQGISTQPIFGGPVYIFRNAMYNVVASPFKMHNNPSGGLMFHNTVVKKGMPIVCYGGPRVGNFVHRNNLFIGTEANYAFESTATMVDCDFDHDGFGGGPWKMFMKWNRVRYGNFGEVKQRAPVYRNAVLVGRASPFASGIAAPGDVKTQFDCRKIDLRLKAIGAAIDAGQVLPGFNDEFTGKGPDLGAYELDAELPHYGPRGVIAEAGATGVKEPEPPASEEADSALKVSTAKTPPKIDGILDDGAWKAAGASTAFRSEFGTDHKGKARVLVTQDKSNLYVALECFGVPATLKNLVADAGYHDEGEIWNDDEMELFLDPTGERKAYYQIIVNAAGVTWDAFHKTPGDPDTSWEPRYQHKVGVGEKSWMIEFALPWRIFDRTAVSLEDWAFNALVHRKRAGEFLYWSPVFSNTAHTPERFGTLAGVGHVKGRSGWRGDGTGRCPDATPPLEWAKDKNVFWKTEVGEGFSSPVVVGKKLFVTAEPDLLLCLDQATGKMLWKRTNGAKDLPENLRDRELEPPTDCGYASPTPCSNGKQIFALFGNGVVACYDLDGVRNWITLIEIQQTEEHGRSASPVLVGDRLVVHVTDLFCLDAQNGKTVWQEPSQAAFGTLLPLKVGELDVVLTPTGDIFRMSDGKKLATEVGYLDVPSPVVHEGVVYSVGSQAKAVKLTATTPTDDSLTVKTLWEAQLDGEFYASPVLHDGALYTVDMNGHFYILDAKTGKTVVSKELEVDSECAPSLNLAAGHVFLQADSGSTFVLKPGREFKLVHKNELGDGSVSTPTLSGERIFIRGEKTLWCIGRASGTVVTAKAGTSGSAAEGPAGSTVPASVGKTPRPPSSSGVGILPASESQAGRLRHYSGWRGNWSGRFPESRPPLGWGKVSKLMSGLRCSAAKPAGDAAQGSSACHGAVTEWLLLGPLPAEEGKGMEQSFVGDEAASQPDAGEKVGEAAWRRCETQTNMLDLAAVFGKDARGVAYAHTYLWSDMEGRVLLRFRHHKSLKSWLNGEAISLKGQSAKVTLKKGWNRLLCKVDWAPQKGQYEVYPSLWHLGVSIAAVPPYESETKGILWQTRLPNWSIASPVVVDDRLYVMSEPNDVVCLNKSDGRILWVRSCNFFDTLTDQEKSRAPFAAIAPKAARLREINEAFTDGGLPDGKILKEKSQLNKEINALMAEADKAKYGRNWGEMHGYTVGTPVTDGRDIYVWISYGIAARYDRDGNRKWIALETHMIKHHGYTSSPILIDGKMIVYMKQLVALDLETGKVVWRMDAARDERLYGDHFHGTPVVISVGGQSLIYVHGMLIRPSDGEVAWEDKRWREKASIPTPVVAEGCLYEVTSSGRLIKGRPADAAGGLPLRDEGKLRVFSGGASAYRRTFVCASPLFHEGLLYTVDCMGNLSVVDAETQEVVYRRDLALGLETRTNVHIFGTAYASPILAGDAILVLGMGGTTVAIKPGRGYVELARNKIEHVTNPGVWYEKPEGFPSSPVCDGDRIYIRGDGHLYCIGRAQEEALTGWRGNTTGLYPGATPVTEWGRRSKGIVPGLRISASKPTGGGPGDAQPIRNNYPKQWLVLGPFPAPEGLEEPVLPNEPEIGASEGDKVGELAWTRCDVPEDAMPPAERGSVAASTPLRFVEPEKALGGFKDNHLVYAHTWLHSEKDGEAELIVSHGGGLAIWLNGKEVYRSPTSRVALNWYTVLSKFRTLAYPITPAPRAELALQKGWNRLLLKSCHGRKNYKTYKFGLRIVDLPDAPCEEENIVWRAPLPDRSNATPLLHGDCIFVMAEPDQLICLNKKTGEPLWTRFLGRYQATPKAERDTNPALKAKVEPLVAKLTETRGLAERYDLRRQIDAALVAINAEKYKLQWDGHMASHFRIVGWTTPSPCSDGKFIYVYCGNGVAACFDLDGNTRWIRRANSGMLYYSSSPALIDGKFVLYAGGMNMVALDAATGKVAWKQPAVDNNVAALVPARINGVGVVITQKGDVVRASDGKLLYDNPLKRKGDTGWAPPVCLDNVIYLPWSGVGTLVVNDFSEASGESWACKTRHIGVGVVSRNSKGKWVDRWTCGSPLIHSGVCYNHDVFGTLYAADLKTGKPLWREDLSADFNLLSHYNAVGVAGSVTLGGKYLFVSDNQGNTVVFEPGAAFRKVAVNRIESQVYRPWAIRPQEEIGYSPPVFDGSRMYLRGEYFLYCIGRE